MATDGSGLLAKPLKELGIYALRDAGNDVHILLLARAVRMFAYGSSTLVLAIYLSALGHSDAMIGLFMTLTLLGDTLISLVLSLFADRLGRRRILVLGAALMTMSGVVFVTTTDYWILVLASVFGVISPSGNEIGPFKAVEESTIAHLTDSTVRAEIFALYVVSGTLGSSMGALLGGWLTQALRARGMALIPSYRVVFWIFAACGVLKATMSLRLSSKCEAEPVREEAVDLDARDESDEQHDRLLQPDSAAETVAPKAVPKKHKWIQLSPESRRTVLQLCCLFSADSLASGMVPSSIIAFYLSRKFDIDEGLIGTVIAAAQFVSSIGNMFAGAVARRIGLVATMVFTHLPSAIFLALIPAPTSLWLTVIILVARSSLNAMDQAPRSAFLAAVVLPEERTSVIGIVNTVKTTAQSVGASCTGLLAGFDRFFLVFLIAGSLKASYDLAMLRLFANKAVDGRPRG